MKNYKLLAEKHDIKIGNRYRIDRMCNDNDRIITSIDFEKGLVTVEKRYGIYNGYKEPERWEMSIEGVIEYTKPNQAYQWIQVDENRKEVKNYKVQITENGKSRFLPQTYTYMQAMQEVEMQEELNSLNAILGEAPAVFDIVEIN